MLSERRDSFLRLWNETSQLPGRENDQSRIGRPRHIHDPGIQQEPALDKSDVLERAIAPFSATYARYAGLVKVLSALRTYIVNNRHLIPNYDERYRHGEPIATGFVESTVNEVVSKRFCKKQQMQWSKEGAHLLLQTRVRTLNGELADIFKRWYPDLDMKAEEISIAA